MPPAESAALQARAGGGAHACSKRLMHAIVKVERRRNRWSTPAEQLREQLGRHEPTSPRLADGKWIACGTSNRIGDGHFAQLDAGWNRASTLAECASSENQCGKRFGGDFATKLRARESAMFVPRTWVERRPLGHGAQDVAKSSLDARRASLPLLRRRTGHRMLGTAGSSLVGHVRSATPRRT
jgi:hypothetical protein